MMAAMKLLKNLAFPIAIAFVQLILQIVFHDNYGYFRDELYYIACSEHLDFGYVDHPPLSIAILWISRLFLGDSLQAIRLLPSLAGAAVVIIAALIARRLGGGKFAQGLAALAVVASPTLLGHARFFTMNAFDVLFWALAAYLAVIILMEDKQRLWVVFGLVLGLGLLNKYSLGFMYVGLTAGLVFTQQRRHLLSRWFWLGSLIAGVLFLPHVVWQIQNNFPSREFMQNASQLKNIGHGPVDFLLGQFRDNNFLNAPLWILGIVYLFVFRNGVLRPLGWMYPIVFGIMVVASAKVYYLAPIYPVLLAGGAVLVERLTGKKFRLWIRPAFSGALLVLTMGSLPFALPVLPVEQFIRYQNFLGLAPRAEERSAVAELPQYYADQFGWEELAATIAGAYAKLTPKEQEECIIFVRNYGEAGAVDFFGRRYNLPNALCGHNSYWLWGPGERPGNVAIIVGESRDLQGNLNDLQQYFDHVELVATTYARYAMPYENGRMIFICKGGKTTIQDLWPKVRFFI